MPLVPEETLRGLKYDLGIAKEGSAFDAGRPGPELRTVQGREGRQGSRRRQGEGRKGSQGCRRSPTSARRPPRPNSGAGWISAARISPACATNSAAELDVKTQAQGLLAAAQARLQEGKEQLDGQDRGLPRGPLPAARSSANVANRRRAGLAGQIKQRWKPLAVLAASGAALAVLLRKLLKG